MSSSRLPVVNRHLAGDVVLMQEVVCNDGAVRVVTVEKYSVGYMFLVDRCTNYVAYPTARRAINAAARASLPAAS